jgi:FolB domain-containing protein
MDILEIHCLSLAVKLGLSDAERAAAQEVEVSLKFQFVNGNKASETDAIKDTLCYDNLAHELSALCRDKEFKLIERLGAFLYDNLKKKLAAHIKTRVAVKKVNPPVAILKNGVTFSCGDEF